MQATKAEQEIIRLIRETQFGSITNIRLTDGQPIIDKNTEVSVEYKLSGIDASREALSEEDYLRKPQVRTMFERFRTIGSGSIECLDVRDGLPFKMTVTRKALI